MQVFMMTYDDVIDKQNLLATPVWECGQLKLALDAEWNTLSQTFLLTRASMNGDNVLKLLSRTMEDILNIFSNNLNDFTVL